MEFQDETNIISVDWRDLAGDPIYFKSAFNTRIVGERIGETIVFLKQADLIQSYDQVHIIGENTILIFQRKKSRIFLFLLNPVFLCTQDLAWELM